MRRAVSLGFGASLAGLATTVSVAVAFTAAMPHLEVWLASSPVLFSALNVRIVQIVLACSMGVWIALVAGWLIPCGVLGRAADAAFLALSMRARKAEIRPFVVDAILESAWLRRALGLPRHQGGKTSLQRLVVDGLCPNRLLTHDLAGWGYRLASWSPLALSALLALAALYNGLHLDATTVIATADTEMALAARNAAAALCAGFFGACVARVLYHFGYHAASASATRLHDMLVHHQSILGRQGVVDTIVTSVEASFRAVTAVVKAERATAPVEMQGQTGEAMASLAPPAAQQQMSALVRDLTEKLNSVMTAVVSQNGDAVGAAIGEVRTLALEAVRAGRENAVLVSAPLAQVADLLAKFEAGFETDRASRSRIAKAVAQLRTSGEINSASADRLARVAEQLALVVDRAVQTPPSRNIDAVRALEHIRPTRIPRRPPSRDVAQAIRELANDDSLPEL